jgi:hypothetical protein
MGIKISKIPIPRVSDGNSSNQANSVNNLSQTLRAKLTQEIETIRKMQQANREAMAKQRKELQAIRKATQAKMAQYKAAAKSQTQPPTNSPTKPSTQPPTNSPTKPSTNSSTQPPTKPSTQPPTQPQNTDPKINISPVQAFPLEPLPGPSESWDKLKSEVTDPSIHHNSPAQNVTTSNQDDSTPEIDAVNHPDHPFDDSKPHDVSIDMTNNINTNTTHDSSTNPLNPQKQNRDTQTSEPQLSPQQPQILPSPKGTLLPNLNWLNSGSILPNTPPILSTSDLNLSASPAIIVSQYSILYKYRNTLKINPVPIPKVALFPNFNGPNSGSTTPSAPSIISAPSSKLSTSPAVIVSQNDTPRINLAPVRKVAYGAISGALVTLMVGILNGYVPFFNKKPISGVMSGAATTIVTLLTSYAVSHGANETMVKGKDGKVESADKEMPQYCSVKTV